MFGTWLYNRVGGRKAIAAGLAMTILGYTASAFVTDMYLFLAVYLTCTGLGPAVIVLPGLFLSWTCDPRRKGLLSGLVLGAYGVGAALFALGFSLLLNPENKAPDMEITVGDDKELLFSSEVASRVPQTLWICAIASTLISLPGVLLMTDRSTRNYRLSIVSTIIPTMRNRSVIYANCPSVRAALRTSAIWNLMLFAYLAYILPAFVTTQFKNYAQKHTHNDLLLSGIGVVALLMHALGRFVVAWVIEYVTFKQITLPACIVLAAMGVAAPFIEEVFLYAACICVIFLGQTCLLTPINRACVTIFGTGVASDVFMIVSIGGMLASFMNIPLVLFVNDVIDMQRYGYPTAFFICAGCSASAVLCILTLKMRYRWQESLIAPSVISK